MMAALNLSHLQVEYVFGEYRQVDARKDVANTIHRCTADIGVDDLARKLYYSQGSVEIPASMVKEIRVIIERSGLVAYVKRAVMAALDGKEVGND